MNFPETLKSLRKEKGLTQEELAEKIYVSRTLISKYESGAIFPTKDNIDKLAVFFQVPSSTLLNQEDVNEIQLKKEKRKRIFNVIFSSIVIAICSLFILLTALPIFPKHVLGEYICYPENDVPTKCYPKTIAEYHNGYDLTLSDSNPILIFALISGLANIILSILILLKKDNKTIRVINYVLFAINIVLFFFTFISIFVAGTGKDY